MPEGRGFSREVTLIKMGPLPANHPLIAGLTLDGIDLLTRDTCPGCKQLFRAGDYVTLLPIGPGEDPAERAKAVALRPYDAVAIPVHWACATGEEDHA